MSTVRFRRHHKTTNKSSREHSVPENHTPPIVQKSVGSHAATSSSREMFWLRRLTKPRKGNKLEGGLLPFLSARKRRKSSSVVIIVILVLCALGLCSQALVSVYPHRRVLARHYPPSVRLHNVTYVVSPRWNPSPSFHYPPPLDSELLDESLEMDFGHLDIMFLADDESTRVIYRNLWDEERPSFHSHEINSDDQYYAFDDDHVRGMPFQDQENKEVDRQCRRASWHRFQFPTCNSFHEMDIVGNTPKYLRCD